MSESSGSGKNDATLQAHNTQPNEGMAAYLTNDSDFATMHLQNIGIRKIWAKALTTQHQKILQRLGVHRVIAPEYEMGIRIAQELNYPNVQNYIGLGDGDYVVEIESGDGGIEADSVALCHQVTTLDRAKLERTLGELRPETMARVEFGLAAALDLPGQTQT